MILFNDSVIISLVIKQIFYPLLSKVLPTQIVFAHCDVPCGIYDPKPAQIAAATVLKMIQLIKSLPAKGSDEEILKSRNSFVRMVWTKEEHARKCKEELLILWTDFFKPEDLKETPNLHEIFWSAAKLCSKNKQEINEEAAKELVKAVDEITNIFNKTKEKRAKH